MKNIRLPLAKIMMVLLLLVAAFGSVAGQRHYKDLQYTDLADIDIPEVEQVTLSNGMRLFLLEDQGLPLVSLSARIRVGSIYETEEKIGLASITGEVMRTGGTMSQSGDKIDEELERLAASVETGIGQDSGFAFMSVLKKDAETGLRILADILMNPAFPEDRIELAKIQRRSSIVRRNDSANAIASREFDKLIYGPKSVYARHMEYATVEAITRQDLVDFHGRFFYPNNMMLAVWGDFETTDMVEKIEKAFKQWKKGDVKLSEISKVNYKFQSTVNLVEKTDVNQSNIYLGHIGGLRNDPDYFALSLMNRILGMGFTSRLFREVRSRQGLAYSVFGHYSAGYDHPGMFFVGCQTKSETTVQAIRAMTAEVRKITETKVTEEELEVARESFLNSFVFNFDSRREIVSRLMTYAYHGYPLDFLQKVKEGIEKVTREEILRVARKRLRPDQMQILTVGRAEDFDEPLSVIGPVNKIDVVIPEDERELKR